MLQRLMLERRRQGALPAVKTSALKDVFAAPLPNPSTHFEDLRFVCFDFETTGLDASRDSILSVGSVVIENGQISVSSGQYDVIAFAGKMDEATLAIHGLTHDALAQGIALDEAMEKLFQQLPGSVLVAHNTPIESGFLDAYCRAKYGVAFYALWVCTLQLERRRSSTHYKDLSLRLGQSRARYNLPRYTAHHALIDALAGAELLLAQAAHRGGADCRLKDLM